MWENKDVRKRLSALAVCGFLVFSTYGNDLLTLAETPGKCDGFVDYTAYEENGEIKLIEGVAAGPDGLCDKCFRDIAAHEVIDDENTPVGDPVEPEPCQHEDEDDDYYCDLCGADLEALYNLNSEDFPMLMSIAQANPATPATYVGPFSYGTFATTGVIDESFKQVTSASVKILVKNKTSQPNGVVAKAYVYRDLTDLANPTSGTCLNPESPVTETIAAPDSDTPYTITFDLSGIQNSYMAQNTKYSVVVVFDMEYEPEFILSSSTNSIYMANGLYGEFSLLDDTYKGIIDTTLSAKVEKPNDVASIEIKSSNYTGLVNSTTTYSDVYCMIGEEIEVEAILKDTNGTVLTGRDVTWSTSDATNVVITPVAGTTKAKISYNMTNDPKTPVTATVRADYNAVGVQNQEWAGFNIVFVAVRLSTDNGTTFVDSLTTSYTGAAIVPQIRVYKSSSESFSADCVGTPTITNNINAGEAEVNVSFDPSGNNTGQRYNLVKKFTISKANISQFDFANAAYTIDTTANKVTAVNLTSVAGLATPIYDVDYSVNLRGRTVVATGIQYTVDVTVKSEGNYTGTVASFLTVTTSNMNVANLIEPRWSGIAVIRKTYTGSKITLSDEEIASSIKFYDKVTKEEISSTFIKDNFTVSFENNENVGNDAKIVWTPKNTYTGTMSLNFRIIAADVSSATISWKNGTAGKYPHEETVVNLKEEMYVTVNGRKLVQDIDYTVSAPGTDAGTYYLTVKGIGNYEGQKGSIPITITPSFELDGKFVYDAGTQDYEAKHKGSIEYTGFYYSGLLQKPAVSVKLENSNAASDNYYLLYSDVNPATISGLATYDQSQFEAKAEYKVTPKAGTKYIIVIGKAGTEYAGQCMWASYTINPEDIERAGTKVAFNVIKSEFTYTGSPINPQNGVDFNLKFTGYNENTQQAETRAMTSDEFTISANDTDITNVSSTQKSFTITGKGNFKGTKTIYFTINARSVTDPDITITLDKDTYAYTGTQITPGVSISYKGLGISSTNYKVEYGTNKDIGTGTVKITGLNNLTGGPVTKTFTITPKQNTVLNITVENYTVNNVDGTCAWTPKFTGGVITSNNVVVTDGGYILVKGLNKDYLVKADSTKNVNVGEGILTIEGKNAYSNCVQQVKFNIQPRSIASSNVEVIYNKNVDSGAKPTFYIVDKSGDIASSAKTTATRAEKTATGYWLTEGKDFDVSYPTEGATTPGEGKEVTITGKGNFEGTITATYNVGVSINNATITLKNPYTQEDITGSQIDWLGDNVKPEVYIEVEGASKKVDAAVFDVEFKSLTRNSTTDIYNAYGESGNTIEVTITPKSSSKYYGTTKKTYIIKPINLNTFNGKPDSRVLVFQTLVPTADGNIQIPVFGYTSKYIDYSKQNGDSKAVKIRYYFRDRTAAEIALGDSDTNNLYYDLTCGATGDYTWNNGTVGVNKSDYLRYAQASTDGNGNFIGKTPAFNIRVDAGSLNNDGWNVSVNSSLLSGKYNNSTVDNVIKYRGASTKAEFDPGDIVVSKVIDGETVTLVNNVDYTISYSNSAGKPTAAVPYVEATLKINGKGNYKTADADSISFVYYINSIAMDDTNSGIVATVQSDYLYTGSQIKPDNVVVTYNGKALTKGTDFEIVSDGYGANIEPGTIAEKNNYVTIKGLGEYSGEIKAYFNIYLDFSKDVDGDNSLVTVELVKGQPDKKTFDYLTDGELTALKPNTAEGGTVAVKYKTAGGVWKDYNYYATNNEPNFTISYSTVEPGLRTVYITGSHNGQYNSGTGTYAIANVDFLADLSTEVSGHEGRFAYLTTDEYDFTNGQIRPEPVVLYGTESKDNGVTGDYIVVYEDTGDATPIGERTVTIKPTAVSKIYKNTNSSRDWAVLKYKVYYNLNSGNTEVYVDKSGVATNKSTYTGSHIQYKIVAKFGEVSKVSLSQDYADPTPTGALFNITDSGMISVGTHSIIVASNSEYVKGSRVLNHEIVGKSFSDDANFKVEFLDSEDATFKTGVYTYTGNNIEPSIRVTDDSKLLTKDVDYTITYNNNLDAGTAEVVITGKGGYAVSAKKSRSFTIKPKDLSTATDIVIDIDPCYYAGCDVEVTPTVRMTYAYKSDWDIKMDNTGQLNMSINGSRTSATKDGETLTLTLKPATGNNNFTGEIKQDFKINRLLLSDSSICKVTNDKAEYTGKVIDVPANLELRALSETGALLKYGDAYDYTYTILKDGVAVRDNQIVNVGNYIIQVKGVNNCDGLTEIHFEVTPRSLANNWAVNGTGKHQQDGSTLASVVKISYLGEDIAGTESSGIEIIDFKVGEEVKLSEKDFVITDGGIYSYTSANPKKLIQGTDYEISYSNNTAAAKGYYSNTEIDEYGNFKAASDSPVIIIKGKGDYASEELRIPFSIGRSFEELKAANKLTVAKQNPDSSYFVEFTYNSEPQKPSPELRAEGNILREDKDYTLTITDANDGDDLTSFGQKKVYVTGTGKYYGTVEYDYYINKRDVGQGYILNNTNLTYSSPITFRLDMEELNKVKILTARESYTMYGTSDFAGFFYIEYNGGNVEPTIEVYDNNPLSRTSLLDSEDYLVTYANSGRSSDPVNGDFGTASVTLTNNYIEQTFTIRYIIGKNNIKNNDFKVTFTENGFKDSVATWDGKEKTMNVEVSNTSLRDPLVQGVDYDVYYTYEGAEDVLTNIDPGTAVCRVVGKGSYEGTVQREFTIIADFKDNESLVAQTKQEDGTYKDFIVDQFQTGEAITPEFRLVLKNKYIEGRDIVLEAGTDYEIVEYNTPSGDNWKSKGYVKVQGISKYYSGTKQFDYNIKLDKNLITVTGYTEINYWTGEPIMPDFKLVTPSGNIIYPDRNKIKYVDPQYRETCVDDPEPDEAVLDEITGENYITAHIPFGDDYISVQYRIVARPISECTIVYGRSVRYTGIAVEPRVALYMEGNSGLTPVSTDFYTVEYMNNIKPGKGAGIVIRANDEHFTSLTMVNFEIVPGKPVSLRSNASTSNTITVQWVKDLYGDGTILTLCRLDYNADGTTNEVVINEVQSKKGQYTFAGLESAKEYKIYAKTYLDLNEDGIPDGNPSATVFTSATTGLTSTTIKVSSPSVGKVKLTWDKTDSSISYMIFRSSDGGITQEKVASIPSTVGAYTDSSLESGRTYYYYVIGYSVVKKSDGSTEIVNSSRSPWAQVNIL